MEFKDYYQVLGVSRNATQDEIKRAYRKMARKYHPDVSQEPDAEARFKEVNEANEVLKDPEKRAAYDQLGANWKAGQDFRPPPDWDQGFEFHQQRASQAEAAAQFSDFFESLFGRGYTAGPSYSAHRGRFKASGQDTHARIFIELEDAYHGASRQLTLKHTELSEDGRPHIAERILNVRIPKGVREGQMIRLAGQGGAGIGGGRAGDLYLEIAFNPHDIYHVEKRDVYLNLPVSPSEAALGKKVEVPTPAGPVDLKVPPNSANGKRLRLKGRGIPGEPAGDLYVVLSIALPPADTEAAREAYRAFSNAVPFNPRARFNKGGRS